MKARPEVVICAPSYTVRDISDLSVLSVKKVSVYNQLALDLYHPLIKRDPNLAGILVSVACELFGVLQLFSLDLYSIYGRNRCVFPVAL